MEPIAETRRTVEEFGPFGGEEKDLLDYLTRAAALVRVIVPTCVGLSLAVLRDGITFTLEASSAEVAALDGVQYLDGGPCVDGAHLGETMSFHADDPTDETRWHLFAASTAARHVASTLTLPVFENGQGVVGTVNLYAAHPRAFDDHREAVARIFGAWAQGAVANADLSFETRRAAEQAPRVIREQIVISQAVGMLAGWHRTDPEAARARLEDAALRAGVDLLAMAHLVINSLTSGED